MRVSYCFWISIMPCGNSIYTSSSIFYSFLSYDSNPLSSRLDLTALEFAGFTFKTLRFDLTLSDLCRAVGFATALKAGAMAVLDLEC